MNFRPINVSLSPNTEYDDARLALKLIFRPWRWLKGDAPKELEEKFCEWFGVDQAFAFRSGRGAFYAALKAIELEPGSEVLIQAYTCAALPNSIHWAGLTPVYVDIDATLNMSPADLEKKITPRSKVIVVQHTFGMPADLDPIIDIAKKNNLVLIEDCAHSLGAKYNNRYVGNLGDISFFSFGKDKVVSGTFGGMLAIRNPDHPEWTERIGALRAAEKEAPRLWILKQLLHPVIMFYLVLPVYDFLNLGKFLLMAFKHLGLISRAVSWPERRGERNENMLGAMPNALAELTLNQLQKLDRFREHRRLLARIYEGELSVLRDGIKLPPAHGAGESIYFRYNVRTQNRGKIIAAARRKNILLDDLFRLLLLRARIWKKWAIP